MGGPRYGTSSIGERSRRNSTSFFPINPADVAKHVAGVVRGYFAAALSPLLESLSAAKAHTACARPVRCDGAHTNAGP